MVTSSPLSLLDDVFNQLATRFPPPTWLVTEAQRKLLIVLNHVLMQEPEATARLLRQKGRVLRLQWRDFSLRLRITPAGLLELDEGSQTPDLSLDVTESSPTALAQQVLSGSQPAVCIAGDVQLAAEINWLSQHVRWDAEDDLARIVGDVPAQRLVQLARTALAALKRFAPAKPEAQA